jgi:hypothetical protein
LAICIVAVSETHARLLLAETSQELVNDTGRQEERERERVCVCVCERERGIEELLTIKK